MRNYDTYKDEYLFACVKDDDEGAYTELYNRYWKRMFCKIARKLDSAMIAEELVQDIFTDIWVRRHEIIIQTSVAAYLSAAVKYKVINAQAKQHRELSYIKHKRHIQENAVNTVEQYLSFEELRETLEQQLALLPEKCSISFKLCRQEGFAQKEVAIQMQTTQKAIERNIARAVKSLSVSMRQFLSFFIF